MIDRVEKTFTITTSPAVMSRIERFLALLHFNSAFGHSGLFAMDLDGDGPDKVEVAEVDWSLSPEVNAIGGVGYHVEAAGDDGYFGYFLNPHKPSQWSTVAPGDLRKDGKVIEEFRLDSDGKGVHSWVTAHRDKDGPEGL